MIPQYVDLVGQRYSIRAVHRRDEALNDATRDPTGIGALRMTLQEIVIADDLGPDQERDTVLHEALHALMGIIGMFDEPKEEERIVGAIAPLLLDAIRRNPAFVGYLVA